VAAKERLSDYNAKRDFGKTKEPRGKPGRARRNSLGFYVQKHAARRLHYDLRLEWDGVLLSWAVTKGPSPDPTQKRLAVRTEDHPMSYAQFEGTIPKKEYGGGTVMLWDKGQWLPRDDAEDGLREGKLKFTVQGARMHGGWTLVRMKPRKRNDCENWLLIKERDEYAGHDPEELTKAYTTSIATARTMDEIANEENPPGTGKGNGATAKKKTRKRTANVRLPRFQKPQLATLTDTVPDGDEWLHESKYDGYRCVSAVASGQARCYSRAGHDWTAKFSRVAEVLTDLDCDSALLDGEIVAPEAAAGSQFSALQAALSEGGVIEYYVFDLLELDGKDLRSRPLIERKATLRKLLGTLPARVPVSYSEHVRGSGHKVLEAMCESGREGIISKKANASYSGRRTRSWLKIKCTKRQEFVIGGFTPSDKRGRAFASLLIGTCESGKLRYRGRVGTGFSDNDLDGVGRRMAPIAQKKSPFESVPASVAKKARWVRPVLVAEVDFTELTNGGHVRHGAFKGLRGDKKAAQVMLELAPDAKPKAREEYQGVRISNPHRVIYPQQGVTKAELARYYDAVAPRMLPLMSCHPVSLLRCPKGRSAKCFFQKHASPGFPEQLKRVSIREKSGRDAEYLYIDDITGLIAGVQMGTLEFHIWGARIDALEKPDRLVFDLDPDESLDFPVVKLAAAVLRQRLEKLGLKTLPLVTGGKGVHVIAPLRRTADWQQVKSFAQSFATKLASDEPDVFTATMSKSRRRGRIFVDWFRNERGATAVAPYSTRAREHGPVATPVSWEELEELESASCFRVDDVIKRLDNPDPWKSVASWRQAVTVKMIERVSAD
jgi:bifunctional non-homologous end joining protein LigD